jgi:FeS assembly SUF system regulator
MIRVSRLADYGVVLACHIASHQGQCHNAYDLAESTGLPAPTVSKLLAALAKAGILISIRGAKGGYRLARSAEQITAADIVTAVDGPIALTICLEQGDGVCDVESLCPTRRGWHRLNEAIRTALASVPLSELALGVPMEPLPWPPGKTAAPPATVQTVSKT